MNKKNKVAIVLQNKLLAEIFASNIKVYTNLDSVIFGDLKSGYESLNSPNHPYRFVITSKFLDNNICFETLYTKFHSDGDLLFFLLDEKTVDQLKYPYCFLIERYDLKSLLSTIAKDQGIRASDMVKLKVESFYPYSLDMFFPMIRYHVSVFCLVEGEYIELLDPESSFSEKQYSSLLDKKVRKLYVSDVDRLTFISHATNGLVALLECKDLSVDDKFKVVDRSQQMVSRLIKELGIDDQTITLSNAAIGVMKDVVDSSKSLKTFLKKLDEDTASYRYRHTVLTLYIGSFLLKKSEWYTDDQYNTLSFICFFHDISLIKDEHIAYSTNKEVMESDLTAAEKESVMNHAVNSAKIISYFPHAPIGVEMSIKRHHGNKSGIGFDEKTLNLSPIECAFVISEELCKKILDLELNKTPFDSKAIIADLSKHFGANPKFKSLFRSLQQLRFD